jgi:UDP-N-acetylglucosamine 2-epimerase (non-hydrolysing)
LSVNFIIGTKAQFIKCIPVINEFIQKDISIRLYDLKQHGKITKALREKILGKFEYIEYSKNIEDIGTYLELIKWFVITVIKIIFFTEKKIRSSYVFIHGDTLSTILGMLLAKRNGSILVLLEAGHSVPGILKHFPESVIRYICAKKADYLIATGESQLDQLKKWHVKGKIVEISRNTIYDSVSRISLQKKSSNDIIVSIHRTENINNRKIMTLLVETLCDLSKKFNVIWFLHKPTRNKLKSYNLINKINQNGIETHELQGYEIFINKMYNSKFVITDGGGVVEECKIIGIPTLVWRNEHIDQNEIFQNSRNLVLSNYDIEEINYFVANYKDYGVNFELENIASPSKEIVREFVKIIN